VFSREGDVIRTRAATVGLALCACSGTLFVDATPPRLRRVVAQYQTSGLAEPLVLVKLLELYVEDPGTCGVAKSWFLDATHRALVGLSVEQVELATRDLAPQCTQREGVALDVDGIVAEVHAFALAHPQAHVRPVILYANNLELPLSPARSSSLGTLAARLTAQQGTPPLVWLVASKTVAKQLVSDYAQDWTYAGDPAVAGAMGSFAQLTLPLQTEAGTVSDPQPLLKAADLEGAQAFKLCAAIAGATANGLPEPGVAAKVDRAAPPRWQVVLPQQLAAPKSAFSTHTVTAKLEVCDGNCDRFYSIDPDQLQRGWDVTKGCALAEGN
jgi:hypothetical protein